jgi:hypothetical protein
MQAALQEIRDGLEDYHSQGEASLLSPGEVYAIADKALNPEPTPDGWTRT